jgi:uncharacterized protein YjiS (DUF1127 family)
MSQLARYEQARFALAECQRVDEVKDIRDKAEAMAAYARQAKDTELIQFATEIKVRAERKCGELLRDSAERGERATALGNVNPKTKVSNDATPTLADIGITRDQSSRYQSLASMSEAHFETAVATAKDTAGEVTTAFMLREAKKAKPKGKVKKGPKAEAMREELKAASERGVSMLCTYARLLLGAIGASESFTEEEREHLEKVESAISNIRSVLQ